MAGSPYLLALYQTQLPIIVAFGPETSTTLPAQVIAMNGQEMGPPALGQTNSTYSDKCDDP